MVLYTHLWGVWCKCDLITNLAWLFLEVNRGSCLDFKNIFIYHNCFSWLLTKPSHFNKGSFISTAPKISRDLCINVELLFESIRLIFHRFFFKLQMTAAIGTKKSSLNFLGYLISLFCYGLRLYFIHPHHNWSCSMLGDGFFYKLVKIM